MWSTAKGPKCMTLYNPKVLKVPQNAPQMNTNYDKTLRKTASPKTDPHNGVCSLHSEIHSCQIHPKDAKYTTMLRGKYLKPWYKEL